MLIRFFLGAVFFSFVLYPQVLSCATSTKADRTVELDRGPAPDARFERVETFAVKYGDDAETTLGFSPGGNETEKLAPNAFEVQGDGSILISDPVHRKVFKLNRGEDGEAALRKVGPYSFSDLPGKEKRDAVGKEAPSFGALKTGAETADIMFGHGDKKKIVRLKVEGPLASVRILGAGQGGEAAVLVTRFKELGSMDVAREILLVKKNGAIVARLKVDDVPEVPPEVEFQMAPDGSLYRMIPGAEAVTFMRYEVRR